MKKWHERRRRHRVTLIQKLFHAQRGICAGCGVRMPAIGDLAPEQQMPSIDHVYSRSSGGGNHIGNMVAMHRRCNSDKGNRAPTGCELIWHELVLAVLGIGRFDYTPEPETGPTLASIWPELF